MDYLDYQLAAAEDAQYEAYERSRCYPLHFGIDPGCTHCPSVQVCRGYTAQEFGRIAAVLWWMGAGN